MSSTVDFFITTWNLARNFAKSGQIKQAQSAIQILISNPDSPARYQRFAHRLAAKLAFDRLDYRIARRHLYACEKLHPDDAIVHHEIGSAFELDPHGCDYRAARRFAKACRLRPQEALLQASFGRSLIRLGRRRSGVKRLLSAAHLAPGDIRILAIIIEGLLAAGRIQRAERILTIASFLVPKCLELDQLMRQVRYHQALSSRKPQRKSAMPSLLTIYSLESTSDAIIRLDTVSEKSPHFNRLRAYRGN